MLQETGATNQQDRPGRQMQASQTQQTDAGNMPTQASTQHSKREQQVSESRHKLAYWEYVMMASMAIRCTTQPLQRLQQQSHCCHISNYTYPSAHCTQRVRVMQQVVADSKICAHHVVDAVWQISQHTPAAAAAATVCQLARSTVLLLLLLLLQPAENVQANGTYVLHIHSTPGQQNDQARKGPTATAAAACES
jgi:hypothetical protein